MDTFAKAYSDGCRRRVPNSAVQKRVANGKDKMPEPTRKLRRTVQRKHEVELLAESDKESIVGTAEIVPKGTYDALQMRLLRLEKEFEAIKQEKLAQHIAGQQDHESACQNCKKLEDELEKVRSLNKDLQRSLLSKIFSAESRIIYAQSLDVSVRATSMLPHSVDKAPSETAVTASHGKSKSFTRLLSARAVPGNVQEQHLPPPGAPTACPASAGVGASQSGPPDALSKEAVQDSDSLGDLEPGSSQGEFGGSQEELSSSQEELSCSQEIALGLEDTAIGSTRDDGKVYAGSGYWLDKEAWGMLMKSPSDSMFCRLASMVYWTPDQLRSRSVTGSLSNRYRSFGNTEAKPALSPQKVASLKAVFRIFIGDAVPEDTREKRLKCVRRHLAQKLGDMQRKN